MIGYVTVGTNDIIRAGKFYDALLGEMGAKRGMENERFIAWSVDPKLPSFGVIKPFDGKPATAGNGVMISIAAGSKEKVNALHAKAMQLGGKDEGAPGPRGDSGFYGAYFRDLDGNKLSCFLHGLASPVSLLCPDCKQPLQSTFYEDVQVNFCLQCKGFFVGKQHLQQIVKIREAVISRDSSPVRRRPETSRRCPQCQQVMKKGKYGKLSTTSFDLCEQCASLWLDQGELDAIQLDYEMVSDNLAKSQTHAAVASAPRMTTAAQPGFKCPKCGHPQTKGSECSRCGIVFAKYQAVQQERAASAAGAAAQTEKLEEVLGRISGFEVLQQHHLTEALLGFERANRYELQPVPASATRGNWRIEESNRSGLSILGRNLLGLWYAFTMNLLDENRNRLLTLERRARLYFMELDVFDENGHHIGAARRRFSWLNRVVSLHDEQGRELLTIVGPLHRPWTFLLRQSGRDAGAIEKRWTGVLKEAYTDADRFSLRLAGDLDTRCKRLVLGGMMLIDSLYFEGRRPFIGHFLGAPGVQIMVIVLVAVALLLSAT